MKKILLLDQRFPTRALHRLTLNDDVASAAAVSAGVAAAADPADAGVLSAGGSLDPGSLTEVVLQHGSAAQSVIRIALPLSVVAVPAAAGLAAAIGAPIAGGPIAPTV